MADAKHTPGPWWVTDSGVRDSGGYICHTNKATHYPEQDERFERETAEREANAHAIAAVPDLLGAAQAVVARWYEVASSLPQNNAIENADWCEFQALRAAIAKATRSAA